jgi:diacylglycerol kinase (ATP)
LLSNKQAVLIVNSRSRRGREWFERVKETLRQTDIELLQAHALREPKLIFREIEAAVDKKVPLVIVGGGDGTLSSAAKYFMDSDSTMGVLPLGTGNQFARDLSIDADVEAACRVLVEGQRRKVDVGVIGDDYFLNVATVGLTTRIAEELTVDAKRKLGRVVYLVALVRALQKVKPFRATLTTDEGTHTFETMQIVVGNGRFHAGPFPLAPDACITDGKLVVYALKSTNRWSLLKYAAHLPGGHHVDMEEVPTYFTTAGKLETQPHQRVTVDGEIEFRTPIKFGVLPGALPVMVPPNFER